MEDRKIKVFGLDGDQPKGDFYPEFKKKLEEVHAFPLDYVFKFIVPSEHSKCAKLYSIFEESGAYISSRDSKNGKYSSFTVKVPVSNADDVIGYYKQVADIESVLML